MSFYKQFIPTGGLNNVKPNVRNLADNELREAININIGNYGEIDDTKITAPTVSDRTNTATVGEISVTNALVFTNYSGSDTTLPYKRAMQGGELVEFHNYRLYVTQGGVIKWSDSLAYDRYDIRGFRSYVDGYITMFKSVDSGIWASWGGKTYYISGLNPIDFNINEKADYGAIGQAVEINGAFIGKGEIEGKVVAWMSERGLCYGTQGGTMINVSIDRYKLPTGTKRSKSLVNISNNGTTHIVSSISAG